ncbi:hypothetical protein GTQ99_04545 [Kineococcus sp. T13]|uniref:hypothetical protein n=1 Tax=Kineococcus vitellinus TaxID=2696565 RepID=UPI00141253E7|nr:hypothetical protein [Kineococcus vitellinus]NAZ74693.1 hypothetical protein [Kineococcus vitellinus]
MGTRADVPSRTQLLGLPVGAPTSAAAAGSATAGDVGADAVLDQLATFIPPAAPTPDRLHAGTGGMWRVRALSTLLHLDLDAALVTRHPVAADRGRSAGPWLPGDGRAHPLVALHTCAVGHPLAVEVAAGEVGAGAGVDRVKEGDGEAAFNGPTPLTAWRSTPPRTAPTAPSPGRVTKAAPTATLLIGGGVVQYLQAISSDSAQRAHEHLRALQQAVAAGGDAPAHRIAAVYFGATWAQVGAVYGLSGHQARIRWHERGRRAVKMMRRRRGEQPRRYSPHHLPSSPAPGSPAFTTL